MSALPENLPEWLKSRAIGEGTLSIEQQEFPFVVIRQPAADLAPPCCAGYDQTSGVYFVSADIPEAYRVQVLRHEMYEFGYLQNGPHACRLAAHYELAHVFASEWQTYAQWRVGVLEALYAWMLAHPAQYTREQRLEVSYVFDMFERVASR